MYMPQSGGRTLAAFEDCPRQSLHSGFENGPRNEETRERPDEMEAESETAA